MLATHDEVASGAIFSLCQPSAHCCMLCGHEPGHDCRWCASLQEDDHRLFMDEDDDDMFQPAYARAAGGDEGGVGHLFVHTCERCGICAQLWGDSALGPAALRGCKGDGPEHAHADAKPGKNKAVKKRAASGSRPAGVKKPRKAPAKKAARGTKAKPAAKPRAKK
jgi:hypothetical protein